MSGGSDHCVILGGGGHAAALVQGLRLNAPELMLSILDPSEALWNTEVLGVPVVGPDSQLQGLYDRGARFFAVGVGSVGDNEPRRALFEFGCKHGLAPLTVMYPSAIVMPSAVLGRGCQLMAGSIVSASATLGDNIIVNTGSIVEHDCQLGDHSHIASGACLGGGVKVGRGAHVGLGASILPGVQIGDAAIVGAGAVVVKDVSPGDVVVGVPAVPIQSGGRR